MATLDRLQKWGWLLFTTALLIPVLCTMHEPPTYIPKLQHSPFKQLMGVLKSWIKKTSKNVDTWKETWQQWKVIIHNQAIAQKHSAHHIHMWPQAILALQVLALTGMGAHRPERVRFGTDSCSISIDNRCSACITHDIANFVDTPRPISGSIKGFGGGMHTECPSWQVGTIRWCWEDNQGMVHDHTIPDLYYIPNGQVQLLSPQHWMQKTMTK